MLGSTFVSCLPGARRGRWNSYLGRRVISQCSSAKVPWASPPTSMDLIPRQLLETSSPGGGPIEDELAANVQGQWDRAPRHLQELRAQEQGQSKTSSQQAQGQWDRAPRHLQGLRAQEEGQSKTSSQHVQGQGERVPRHLQELRAQEEGQSKTSSQRDDQDQGRFPSAAATCS